MRAHYRRRRDETVAALKDLFGNDVDILGSSAGLHLVARFPGRTFSGEFFAAMERRGVRLYAVATHAIDPETHQDELLLGYGNLDTTDIRRGLERLADGLRAGQRQGGR
jgi:GntR family transcriptional regulator/MocR family aminotransferase